MSNAVAIYESNGSFADAPSGVLRLELALLRPGCRLRHGKLNREHLNSLILSGGNWPPLVVRRGDNTIVDGNYRYLAARELGHTHVSCICFDGGDEDVFLEALQRNRSHGLPLSLAEREEAASQLLGFHPEWSDRRLAEACGLAPGTVGRLRKMAAPLTEPVSIRVGRDGKRRSADSQQSRQRVLNLLESHPGHSLREIARMAGTSPETVRSLRKRAAAPPTGEVRALDAATELPSDLTGKTRWTSDSALQSAPESKDFLSWFEKTTVAVEWRHFVQDIPLSRVYEVADEARRRAEAWQLFASTLEARTTPGHARKFA
jgi:ParB-like chromosome segregation protein Spo0J